jgi:Na+/proline symporter
MTLVGIAAVISSVSATLAVVVSLMNRNKIQKVHLTLNSRLDQLLASHGAAERAAGIEEERDRDRNKKRLD